MKNLLRSLLLLSVCFVLCSCELAYKAPEKGKVHILVYGNDYWYGTAAHEDPNDPSSPVKYYSSKVYFDEAKTRFRGTVKSLGATLSDALEVSNALEALAQKAGYPPEDIEVTRLLGVKYPYTWENITRQSLLDALENLKTSVQEGDLTMIYFSCHGDGPKGTVRFGEDVTESSYLVLRLDDGTSDNILYPVADLLARIESIPGTKVLIGDFCNSGALVRPGNVSVTYGEYSDVTPSSLFFSFPEVTESSSLFVLSAARYCESSYEEGIHGYFTRALLEALGWNEDSQSIGNPAAMRNGQLCFFDMARYVRENDNEPASKSQTPMNSGGSGDLVLFSFR